MLVLEGVPRLVFGTGESRALNRLDAALLCVLAIDGPTPRSRLLELLWPEAEPEAARNLLRQRLFRLRKAAGFDVVDAGERLVLHPDAWQLGRGDPGDGDGDGDDDGDDDPAPAIGAAGPSMLLGDDDYDELPRFAAWLREARASHAGAQRRALGSRLDRRERAGRLADALRLAERLAAHEPFSEAAHRRVLSLQHRLGDRAAALAAHATFAARLHDELRAMPSSETLALVRLVQSGEPPSAAPRSESGPAPAAAWPALQRPPRIVGRDGELAALAEACERGGLLLLRGEAGIGKSRLLGDLCRERGLPLVAARPGDARVPGSLLARLLRRVVPAERVALEPWVREALAGYLPELGTAATARHEPLHLVRAVAWLIAPSAPHGWAIDDLHFADEASLELLPGLRNALPALPCLLASRSGEEPAKLRDWRLQFESEHGRVLELAALHESGVSKLLALLALPGFDAAAWAPRLWRHCGGNPFFVLETVRALAASGLALQAPPAQGELPLPGHVRAGIERRIATLSPIASRLARVAAFAGDGFDVELAAAVLELHPLDLLEPWRELEQALLFGRLGFEHDLVLETFLDDTPLALRRWLHGRIATVLEPRGAEAARLAQHWQEAAQPARAAPLFMRAAEQARRGGRISEESRWLEAAIAAFETAGLAAERFDAMARRAVSALESLSPTEAEAAAQAVLAAARDERERGIAHRGVAACHMHAARFDLAEPELLQAIDASTRAGDAHSANHARYLHALSLAQVRSLAAAAVEVEALLPWAEALADPQLQHTFLADFAIVLDQSDQRARARPYFERALGWFDRARDTGNAASTRMMFGRSLLVQGELDAARTQLELALRERDELSEGEGAQGIEALNLGRVWCELGRYRDALALLEPSYERLGRFGLAVPRAATGLVMARIHAHLGQVARALALCRELPAEAPFHQQAMRCWTEALLAIERPAQRRRLLGDAVAAFAATDLPFVRLPIEFDAIGMAHGDAAVERCRSCLAEGERRELHAPRLLGRARLVQLLLGQGRAEEAHVEGEDLTIELASRSPAAAYLPELHGLCHRAAVAAGDTAAARRSLDAALAWIFDTAQVPSSFRESFLQRNPINRALLGLAGKL